MSNAEQLRCDAEGHCITCSDEAVPLRVVALTPALGVALCEDALGRCREVLIGLLDDVVPGEVVLVHAGAALARGAVGLEPGELAAGEASPDEVTRGAAAAGVESLASASPNPRAQAREVGA